jgi:hypothetical protein
MGEVPANCPVKTIDTGVTCSTGLLVTTRVIGIAGSGLPPEGVMITEVVFVPGGSPAGFTLNVIADGVVEDAVPLNGLMTSHDVAGFCATENVTALPLELTDSVCEAGLAVPTWYKNGSGAVGVTVSVVVPVTLSDTGICARSPLVVLCATMLPEYVPTGRPEGSTLTENVPPAPPVTPPVELRLIQLGVVVVVEDKVNDKGPVVLEMVTF